MGKSTIKIKHKSGAVTVQKLSEFLSNKKKQGSKEPKIIGLYLDEVSVVIPSTDVDVMLG